MSLVPILGALFGIANGWGYIGESKVSVAAMFGLPRPTYTPFRDVTLPVPDGTTQVDHVFVRSRNQEHGWVDFWQRP